MDLISEFAQRLQDYPQRSVTIILKELKKLLQCSEAKIIETRLYNLSNRDNIYFQRIFYKSLLLDRDTAAKNDYSIVLRLFSVSVCSTFSSRCRRSVRALKADLDKYSRNSETFQSVLLNLLDICNDTQSFVTIELLCTFTTSSDIIEKTLKKFQQFVLDSKEIPALYVLEASILLLQKHLTENNLKQTFSTVEKLVLRSPEIIIPNLTKLFKDITMDLTTFLESIFDSAVKNLKSSNPKLRDDLVELLQLLFSKSTNVSLKLTQSLSSTISDRTISADTRASVAKVIATISKISENVLFDLILKEKSSVVIESILRSIVWVPDTAFIKSIEDICLKSSNSEIRAAFLTICLKARFFSEKVSSFVELVIREPIDKTSRIAEELLLANAVHLDNYEQIASKEIPFILNSKKIISKVSTFTEIKALSICWSRAIRKFEPEFLSDGLELVANLFFTIRETKVDNPLQYLIQEIGTDFRFLRNLIKSLKVVSYSLGVPLWSDFVLALVKSTGFTSNLMDDLFELINHANSTNVYEWPTLARRLGMKNSEVEKIAMDKMRNLLGELLLCENSDSFEAKSLLICIKCALIINDEQCSILLKEFLLKEIYDSLSVENFSKVDFDIWKLPEGTLSIDIPKIIESIKTSSSEGKIEAWELQLKTEMNLKRISEGKFTNDEKNAIDIQRLKDQAIRKNIQRIRQKIMIITASIETILKAPVEFFSKVVQSISLHLINLLDLLLERGDDGLSMKIYNLLRRISFKSDSGLGYGPVIFNGQINCLSRLEKLRQLIAFNGFSQHLPLRIENINVLKMVHEFRFSLTPANFCFIYSYVHLYLKHLLANNGEIFEELNLILDLISANTGRSSEYASIAELFLNDMLLICSRFPILNSRISQIMSEFCRNFGSLGGNKELNVILTHLYSNDVKVRRICLESLEFFEVDETMAKTYATKIWLCCFDEDHINCEIARGLWESNGMEIGSEYIEELKPELDSYIEFVRNSAALSIAAAIEIHPNTCWNTFQKLVEKYVLTNQACSKKRLGDTDLKHYNSIKFAVAIALQNIWTHPKDDLTEEFLCYLVSETGCLSELDYFTWQQFLNAGIEFVRNFGNLRYSDIFNKFTQYLLTSTSSELSTTRTREAILTLVTILTLSFENLKVRTVELIEIMLKTRETSSESYQKRLAFSLKKLVQLNPDFVTSLVERLLDETKNSDSTFSRKGSSYALAGVLGGLGICALQKFNIVDQCILMIKGKVLEHKQGGLFLIKGLCVIFKRQFDVYVNMITPVLLESFGDSSSEVRTATRAAAQALMSVISLQCAKLMLPSLLNSMNDSSWRTKVGAVEFLGFASHLSSLILSKNLVKIIPSLTETLKDSHKNVQKAAKDALEKFTESIGSLEIRNLMPVILRALSDPLNETENALLLLMKTSYEHYLDAASLALLIPIIQRGLKERSSSLKKNAALLIGSLTSITDYEYLKIHFPSLIPLLREVLVDPLPEVRAVAAKTFGLLVENYGGSHFSDLVQDFFDALRFKIGVDRQGYANGLAEILHGLGATQLNDFLPRIFGKLGSENYVEKEGYAALMVFLPLTFGSQFLGFINEVVPRLLPSLSDPNENVRESILKTLQILIESFPAKSIELMMPKLQLNVFDDLSRVRESSVLLIGDILKRVGMGSDDQFHKSSAVSSLGTELYMNVMATIFLSRFDSKAHTRQSAVQIWKMININTPKAVKELIPYLVDKLTIHINSSIEGKLICQSVIQELLGKYVDVADSTIISDFISCCSPDKTPVKRIGGYLCLLELINCLDSDFMDLEVAESLKIFLINGVGDSSEEIRIAAVKALDCFSQKFNVSLTETLIPGLVRDVFSENEKSKIAALDALKELMKGQSSLVISAFLEYDDNSNNFGKNLALLLQNSLDLDANSLRKIIHRIISLRFNEDLGVALVTNMPSEIFYEFQITLLEKIRSKDTSIDCSCCFELFRISCTVSKANVLAYFKDWAMISIECIFRNFCVESAEACMNCIIKNTLREDYLALCMPIFLSVQSFEPKILNIDWIDKVSASVLPILIQGIVAGNPEVKEKSSITIELLLSKSSDDALKRFCIPVVGPLIRILGEKYPTKTKEAALDCIALFLERCQPSLKPFMPQLQRSFFKICLDDNFELHEKGCDSLRKIAQINTQKELLLKELLKGIGPNEKQDLFIATLDSVLLHIGDLNQQSSLILKRELFLSFMWTRKNCAEKVYSLIGKIYRMDNSIFTDTDESIIIRNLRSSNINEQVGAVKLLSMLPWLWANNTEIFGLSVSLLDDFKADVRHEALKCVGNCLMMSDSKQVDYLVPRLLNFLSDEISDIRVTAIELFEELADKDRINFKVPIPFFVGMLKEKSDPVKTAAAKAIKSILKSAASIRYELYKIDIDEAELRIIQNVIKC